MGDSEIGDEVLGSVWIVTLEREGGDVIYAVFSSLEKAHAYVVALRRPPINVVVREWVVDYWKERG